MADLERICARFDEGVALSLGITTSLGRRRRKIERSDTVAEAWASVGRSLRRAMNQTPRPTSPRPGRDE